MLFAGLGAQGKLPDFVRGRKPDEAAEYAATSRFPRVRRLAHSFFRLLFTFFFNFVLGLMSSELGGLAPASPSLSSSPSEDDGELAVSLRLFPLPLRASEPFLTPTFKPCLRRAFSRALLARMPGKSFAVYTLKTSDTMDDTFPLKRLPADRFMGSTRKSLNFSRYFPGERQLRSGKTKNVPAVPFSSLAWYGEATIEPINRRVDGMSG